MTGVLRSWACLNARCGARFDSWQDYPECPTCHGVRVNWVPGGGHVMGTAKAADAELRTLADNYGLSDLMSARRGERAKPPVPNPVVEQRRDSAVQFAPGFAAVANPNRATCQPSMQKVNFKAKTAIGNSLPHSRSVPGVHAGTAIEARHNPRGR
jgi:hypothetical protein